MDIVTWLPQFGGFLWTLLAFVVALSIIVAIHEYGHYIVGRWSGIHAEVFSLGFGPVLLKRTDRRGTQWQFALFPLGGYVKFKGDANPSGGADEDALRGLSADERRSTMTGAPLWARAATVAAGPLFNFALSIIVFTGIFMLRGTTAEPLAVGDLYELPMTQELRIGDELVAIEGEDVPPFESGRFGEFLDALPVEETLDYTVRRNGSEEIVQGPYVQLPLATEVLPLSAASDAGLESGDVIQAVNGQGIVAFDELREIVESSEGAPLDLTVWREGETLDLTLEPRRVDEPQPGGSFRTVYRIGVAGGMFFQPATVTPGPFEAFGAGVAQTGEIMRGSISGLWHMITGAISTCNLSGPIGIAETSGAMASQGTQSFIWFIAVLSTAVGLLNLFPVPVLDGGHLVFYAYEAVSGRPPSDKALRVLMSLGLTLVLGLMVFALTNDIFCP
ncbi:zinc metalloprotease [Roseivivax halodurans JCM 10272]|uniref:Zinc metalloprotease n=1 Tax=Roseivivax halodurans JCM 10272 TaxID=1449350 RepID=X7EL26_9RHOB|nr:RIP metalloprotease RseP [Roseivivax halodurans]ETX16627.1 zinc metalloprotease [Roseivivax halodurans JCM 10272]